MTYRDKHDERFLENLEREYKKMEADNFEEDFERRKSIFEVEGQIDCCHSDNSLRSILTEQHEMLLAEKKGHEKLMDSLREEILQVRKEIEEKEGEKENGKNSKSGNNEGTNEINKKQCQFIQCAVQ